MFQVDGIIGIGPPNQARADARQFAEFLLDRVEVGEGRNRVCGGTGDAGLNGVRLAALEDFIGRPETLEQQSRNTRADTVNTSEG